MECGAQRESGWRKLGPTADPWLGKTIGERYLLTRGIGAGASGHVYRAESLAISRQFAVKIVPLDADGSTANSENVRARLNREIGALGQLRNPHVVSFYDVLPIGESAVALLMDLIEGRTLQDEVWAAGSLGLRRALKILRQIANGVHEAHEANMIHRDLKPDNIMIERLPAGDDFVHILDFGIVRRLDDVRVTHGFLGTPLYASPEQAVGGDIDRRADIYSLGAVTFFMLTGKPPFDDDNVYRVLKSHVGTAPPSLSEVAPERYFPDEIEQLIARMLAKKPEDRPQSLAEVINTLDSFGSEISTTGRDQKTGESSDYLQSVGQNSAANRPKTGLGLNQTVQSDVSAVEAARTMDPPSSKGTASSGAPESAIFQRRKSDVALDAIPRDQANAESPEPSQKTQTGVPLPTETSAELSDDENTHIYTLSGNWYGRDIPVQTHPTEKMRANFEDRYWSALDSERRIVVGQTMSSDVRYFEVADRPIITAMAQRKLDVFTGHADGSVILWNDEHPGGKQLHQNGSQSSVAAMVCSRQCFLFGTNSGGVYLALFDDGAIQPLRIQSGAAVRVLASCGEKSSFAVARANGFIEVFGTAGPKTIMQRINSPKGVTQLTFSGDGYLLAAAFEDKKVILYNCLTGSEIARSETMNHAPRFIHFDRDGRLVGQCEIDGEFFGFDLQRHLFSQASTAGE